MTPSPGLCGSCRHARIVENRHGSRFWLCRLWKEDPEFQKYPALPVLACSGFRKGRPAGADIDEGEEGEEGDR